MLQALRFVIQGAGAKVDPAIKKNITTTLLGMLGHDEVLQLAVVCVSSVGLDIIWIYQVMILLVESPFDSKMIKKGVNCLDNKT